MPAKLCDIASKKVEERFKKGDKLIKKLEKSMAKLNPEFYDESKINSFIGCPRAGYFSWRLKIKPVDSNFALDYGSISHDTLAFFFNRILGEGGVIKDIDPKKLLEWGEIAVEEFADFYAHAELSGNDNKNLDVGVKIFRKDFAEKGYDYGKILEVEATIMDGSLNFAGKVDLIAEQDGVIKIIDHKTTERKPSDLSKWKMRRAFIGYRHLTELKYPNADRYDTIVNILHCIKSKPNFIPERFTIPQFRVNEWKENTQHFVNQIKMWDTLGVYPKTGVPCNDYYFMCPFLSLCNTNKPLSDMVIGGDFERKGEWYV